MVRLSGKDYSLLASIIRNTPSNVPNRDNFIKLKFAKYRTLGSGSIIDVRLGYKVDGVPAKLFNIEDNLHYNGVKTHIENLESNLMFSDDFPEGPVMITKEIMCCGIPITIPSTGNVAKLYTLNGVKTTTVFVGRCTTCTTIYYPHFTEKNGEPFSVRVYQKPEEFFCTSRSTVFEVKLLRQTTINLEVCGFPFVDQALAYNRTNSEDSILDRRVLSDGFFQYNISFRKPGKEIPIRRDQDGHSLDIEFIARHVYTELKETSVGSWIKHRCRDRGCELRAAVIDGNEKCYRQCCAAPAIRVISPDAATPNYTTRCINDPDKQNKKINKPDKPLCKDHLMVNEMENASSSTSEVSPTNQGSRIKEESSVDNSQMSKTRVNYVEETDNIVDLNVKSSKTGVQMDLKRDTRRYGKDMAEVITTGIGCRGEEKIKKYANRTAGIGSVIRTCGTRLNTVEMYTTESLTQLFLALVDTFGYVENGAMCIRDVEIVILDRADDMVPYLKNLAESGNELAHRFLMLILFVLDTWHADKHVKSSCNPEDYMEEFCFHPRSSELKFLKGINFEAGERNFREVNKTKSITRYLCHCTRLLFFLFVDDEHNRRIEEQMEKDGLLVTSGQPGWWDGMANSKVASSTSKKRKLSEKMQEPMSATASDNKILITGKTGGINPKQVLEQEKIIDIKFSTGPMADTMYVMINNEKVFSISCLPTETGDGELAISQVNPPYLVEDISCGYKNSIFVFRDGRVATAIDEGFSMIHVDTKIISVSCGLNFTVLLSEGGIVYTFGDASNGQLGRDVTEGDSQTPHPITKWNLNGLEEFKIEITKISCGARHTIAIDVRGKLFTWGKGTGGQLGHRSEDDEWYPRLLMSLNRFRITEITCGANFSLVQDVNGTVFKMGHFSLMKSTKKSTIPLAMHNLNRPTKILANKSGYFALTSDGKTLGSIQDDKSDLLGLGKDQCNTARPKEVLKLLKVLEVGVAKNFAAFCTNTSNRNPPPSSNSQRQQESIF